jgi:hypothetical protein
MQKTQQEMTDGLENVPFSIYGRPPMPSRWTLMDEALTRITPQQSDQLFQEGARYSEATLLKHKWVRRLYEGFTFSYTADPWPLDCKMAAAFIRFCGIHASYSVNSIEDVILPSLKRIHEEETNTKISIELGQYLSNAMRDVRRTKKSSMKTCGRDAAIGKDVERIVSLTPDTHIEKASEASAWLCALYTGARAITITSVLLMDIIAVFKLDNQEHTDRVIVRIRYTRTKGLCAWNHVVSIEGRMKTPGVMDFVFFLNKHLFLYFGVHLEDYEHWKQKLIPEQLRANLWRWNTGSIRELFKKRSEYAGYSTGLLSFHSLRAGFICTAIIQAGTNREQVAAVLEHTAYVAGWSPMGNAQTRYVKETVKRTIVSNRLVCGRATIRDEVNDGSHRAVIEAGLTDPEHFHCLASPLKNKWPRDFVTLDTFCGQLKVHMIRNGIHIPQCNRQYANMLCVIYSKFCEDKPDLVIKAKRRAWRSKEWRFKDRRHGIILRAYARIGREAIQRCLLQGSYSIPEMVAEVSEFIQQDDETEKKQVQSKNDDGGMKAETRPLHDATGGKASRKRIMWTKDETAILLAMVDRECQWSEIARELYLRSGCDCKDKYRNIMKARAREMCKSLEVPRRLEMENKSNEEGYLQQQQQQQQQQLCKETTDKNIFIVNKRRQKRKLWTPEEDAILSRMTGEKKSWVTISRCIIGRSNVDCKDRHRNINK